MRAPVRLVIRYKLGQDNSPMQYLIGGIILVAALGGFFLLLRHFRRQRDFEGTGRVPPEHYD